DRAVVDQRHLVAPPGGDVAVDGIVAGVHLAADEPTGERRPAVVEHLIERPAPLDGAGGLGPEPLAILDRAVVDLLIAALHGRASPPGLKSRTCPEESGAGEGVSTAQHRAAFLPALTVITYLGTGRRL